MKPFDIATEVTLECPACRAYKTVPRSPELPPEVRLIEIICPDCDDGDFHSETWFSAPGVEVSVFANPKCDGLCKRREQAMPPIAVDADLFERIGFALGQIEEAMGLLEDATKNDARYFAYKALVRARDALRSK